MADRLIEHILRQFETGDAEAAWGQFLDEYAPIIYQVVRHLEPDGDQASDCFQSVCEQLVTGRFRRLRQFKPDGPATFATWLRAVVRNICLDRRRKEFGRPRLFRSISRLSTLDQEVFHHVYERGTSLAETALLLAARYPDFTPSCMDESIERIEKELTTTQRWRVGEKSGLRGHGNLAALGEPDTPRPEMRDPRPDPELQAILRESQATLQRSLAKLSTQERLLIRMRFEEELTLEQIARLLDLGNAQRADRQIKDILARLRQEMNLWDGNNSDGKRARSSVKETVRSLASRKWKKPI